TLLLHRTANFRDLAQVFHDVAHVCDLARAGKPRRARYIYGCEAAADRARLGRDLEPDRAGRLLRDQGHAIEQVATEQVWTFEAIAEPEGEPEQQAQAARHHGAPDAVRQVGVARQHHVVATRGGEEARDLVGRRLAVGGNEDHVFTFGGEES